MRLALIDHGAGNLRSVQKALEAVGAAVDLTHNPEVILGAEKVVLPGVGAFADAMTGLKTRGLIDAVSEVVSRKTPLLGICVGMQMLFEHSEEHGIHEGLGFLPGGVKKFSPNLPGNGAPFKNSSNWMESYSDRARVAAFAPSSL